MLKLLHTRTLLMLGLLVFGFSSLMVFTSTPHAYADISSACGGYNERSQERIECATAYTRGKNGGKANCPASGSLSEACKKGFNAGKNAQNGNDNDAGEGNDNGSNEDSEEGPGGINGGQEAGPGAGPNLDDIDCEKVACEDPAADPDADCNSGGCDLIKKYINPTIKMLSVLVGLVATISIILGGVQYSMAGNDPQKVSGAKDRISKTIIAFVAYFFLAAFLEFLVPGGIFR